MPPYIKAAKLSYSSKTITLYRSDEVKTRLHRSFVLVFVKPAQTVGANCVRQLCFGSRLRSKAPLCKGSCQRKLTEGLSYSLSSAPAGSISIAQLHTNGGVTFVTSDKSNQKRPSGKAFSLPTPIRVALTVGCVLLLFSHRTERKPTPKGNLCGSPSLLPLWTPEWCRIKCRLGAVLTVPQLRSGEKRKFVAALSSDTEFWSGPRQNRHRSKHDCNRVGLQKLLFPLIPWAYLPPGKVLAKG